jgi:NADH-quinone oxidoreductase subunit M
VLDQLNLLLWLPLLGAVAQAFLPSHVSRTVGLALSLIASILGFVEFSQLSSSGTASVEHMNWIGSYGISYLLSFDGLNALPVLLVSICFPMLLLFEWNAEDGRRGLYALILLLQSALAGLLLAQDLFLLFFFLALSSLPIYFLGALWGGKDREKGSVRFLVVSSLSIGLFFLAALTVYFSIEPHQFELAKLAASDIATKTIPIFGADILVSKLAFWLFLASALTRLPVWPAHSWFLSLTRCARPSVLVAILGIFCPVTFFIFARLLMALFPTELKEASGFLLTIGLMNAFIPGLLALSSSRLRETISYLALSQFGFLWIGLSTLQGVSLVGMYFQVFGCGTALVGITLLFGILKRRIQNSEDDFEFRKFPIEGLHQKSPFLASVAGLVLVALIGFPGLSTFVGQYLLFMGSFTVSPWIVLGLALSSCVVAASCIRVFHGLFLSETAGERWDPLAPIERVVFMPVLAIAMIAGIVPRPFIDLLKPMIDGLLKVANG